MKTSNSSRNLHVKPKPSRKLDVKPKSSRKLYVKPKSSRKLYVKLVIDKKDQKVLLAETDKDFVDFLFGLLSLPIRTIIKLVSKDDDAMAVSCSKDAMVGNSMDDIVGCLAKLYETTVDDSYKDAMVGCLAKLHEGSIENFDDSYMQPNVNKDMLLNPKNSVVADVPHTLDLLTIGRGGYVREQVKYLILDDLTVEPPSFITCLAVLNRAKIDLWDHASREGKIVTLGMDEVIKLAKALLQSKSSVLTDAFLGKSSA